MSTTAQQRKKALKAYAKRRANRPIASVTETTSLKIGKKLERQTIDRYQDVLQNIEFMLVQYHRESPYDDATVAQVLSCAIRKADTDDHVVAVVLGALAQAHDMREDIPGEAWQNALRVVYASVRRHSTLEPGDTSYLDFVSGFVR